MTWLERGQESLRTRAQTRALERGGEGAGHKTQRTVTIAAGVLFSGVSAISVLLAFGTSQPGWQAGVDTGVTAFLLAVVAAMVGAGLGFLFGMPRSRFTEQLGEDGSTGSSRAAATPITSRYLANSNLIKVSDWLTTIVVGLGLVNLGRVVPAMQHLASALNKPLGGGAYSGAVGLSILIAAFVAGLLLIYLWTSIRVRELLEDAEDQFEVTPRVTDKKISEAKTMLGTTTLALRPPVSAAEDDKIVQQSPQPGTTVRKGTTISVAVTGDSGT